MLLLFFFNRSYFPKTVLKNQNLVLVVFNVFLLVFNKRIYTHCIYKLISLLQDVLITSLFRQGGETSLEQVQSHSNLLLLAEKHNLLQATGRPVLHFLEPLAIIPLKHPDLLHYHQTNTCPGPSGVHKLRSPAVGRHD